MTVKIAKPITPKDFSDMGIYSDKSRALLVEGAVFEVEEKRLHHKSGKHKYHLVVGETIHGVPTSTLLWVWEDFVQELH